MNLIRLLARLAGTVIAPESVTDGGCLPLVVWWYLLTAAVGFPVLLVFVAVLGAAP